MNEKISRELAEKYPELIPEPFDEIINNLGFDALFYLIREFSGTSLYIPNSKKIFCNCINAQLKHEFNGSNYKTLARKYGFCERSIASRVNGTANI